MTRYTVTVTETTKGFIRGKYATSTTRQHTLTSKHLKKVGEMFDEHEADSLECAMVKGDQRIDIKIERRGLNVRA